MNPRTLRPLYLFIAVCFLFLCQTSQSQSLRAAETPSQADAGNGASIDSGAAPTGEPGTTMGGPTSPDPAPDTSAKPDPNRLQIIIYPLKGWAPIMGANVRVPDTPSTPGGGGGNTNSSLNGAALFGIAVQKAKWYGELNFTYAGLSASRSNPLLNVNVDATFAGGLVGYDVWKYLYVTGGFRYLGLRYGITLGDFPVFKRSPGVTDPLVGVMWNQPISKKWALMANLQGGGFGVGSEEDSSATGQANWQFAKHFGLMFGYGILHFKIDNTKFGKTLTVNQTLNGPQFGFGIYF
jgi:hypothetical protein